MDISGHWLREAGSYTNQKLVKLSLVEDLLGIGNGERSFQRFAAKFHNQSKSLRLVLTRHHQWRRQKSSPHSKRHLHFSHTDKDKDKDNHQLEKSLLLVLTLLDNSLPPSVIKNALSMNEKYTCENKLLKIHFFISFIFSN